LLAVFQFHGSEVCTIDPEETWHDRYQQSRNVHARAAEAVSHILKSILRNTPSGLEWLASSRHSPGLKVGSRRTSPPSTIHPQAGSERRPGDLFGEFRSGRSEAQLADWLAPILAVPSLIVRDGREDDGRRFDQLVVIPREGRIPECAAISPSSAVWLLLVGSVTVAMLAWGANPAPRSTRHIGIWLLRLVLGAMWWQHAPPLPGNSCRSDANPANKDGPSMLASIQPAS
jgi:hypothetical protein